MQVSAILARQMTYHPNGSPGKKKSRAPRNIFLGQRVSMMSVGACGQEEQRRHFAQSQQRSSRQTRFSKNAYRGREEKLMIRKTVWIVGLFASVMLATLLLSAASLRSTAKAAEPTTAEVKVDNFSFGPATLTVAVGTTVTWTNRDDIPHTVVSTDKVFKSKVLDTDEKFSFTFAKAGTYPYFCSIHPKMTGSVVVQ
jgi:plastocyanin